MELFLSGSDPQIPYFLENGPHVPTQTVLAIPAAGNQPALPERELVKPVTDWNDEDRRLVNIDTKARSLITMSLPDDVFHSVCHLRSAKEIWDTLCVLGFWLTSDQTGLTSVTLKCLITLDV
ncbi:hypothetical protein OSB04_011802 [Centaurea solstitialis]|uniref:Uncharacterized protein n=1 Tax=Centaurea solstitialis TaxID=347529 RepID=A0AA38TA56_9ASTR|nr:hypothetical protein OSB04_011802 [Centaurea solstitialis]